MLIVTVEAGRGLTVTLHEAETSPHVAVIEVDPTDTAVTVPSAATVAMSISPELQLTDLSVVFSGVIVALRVSFCPTINMMSCTLILIADGFIGLTVMIAVSLILPQVADIFTSPGDIAMSSPVSLLIVAMSMSSDSHTIEGLVTFSGLMVAVKVILSPTRISVSGILILIEDAGTGITVTKQLADASPTVAERTHDPGVKAVTKPV